MQDNNKDRLSVYEIGYLIASSIPEEQLSSEVEKVKKIIADAKASIIAEEIPHKEDLAYTIRRKTVAGSYEKFDQAYFGWVKFEVDPGIVESIKKSIEIIPNVIRMILITTVRENTYLGKHFPASAKTGSVAEVGTTIPGEVESAPATIEEIDKSIDDMIKEA